MRIVLLLALVSLPLPVHAAEPSTALEITVELAPESPRPGERIYWLGRVRNASGRTLYVPAELRSWLRFDANHQAPAEMGGWGQVGRAKLLEPPPLQWIPLGPGEVIEAGGDVAESVPRCRRGCPEGTLSALFWVDADRSPSVEGEARDHVVPAALRAATQVEIRPAEASVLERQEPAALRVTALGVQRRGDDTLVRVRLENATSMPLWVPKPQRLEVTGCEYTDADGSGGGSGSFGSRHAARADPAGYVRLRPGGHVEGSVTASCPVARGGVVSVWFTAPAVSGYPPSFDPPFVWSGTAEVGPVRRER